MITIKDMPKLESPFVRETNANGDYVVKDEIAEGYEWVFNDTDVLCTEKLDGTNVSIIIEDNIVKSIYNRTEKVPFINKHKQFIIKGILESYRRGYMERLDDGQFFGELIGESVNGNPLHIAGNLWIPFETYAQEHLAYKSWGKYPKTFDAISTWFKNDIFSLYVRQHQEGKVEPPEGVVFVQPSTGKMAKLRRDMFDWFGSKRHKEMEGSV